MPDPTPLIQLEENAQAPVLRYDIPEPTSYEGQNFIELQFEEGQGIFTQSVFEVSDDAAASLRSQPVESIRAVISSALRGGGSFAPTRVITGSIATPPAAPTPPAPPEPPRGPASSTMQSSRIW